MIADSYFCGWGKLGSSEEFKCRFCSLFYIYIYRYIYICLYIYISLNPNTTILILHPLKCSHYIFVFRWVPKKNWKSY